MRLSLFWKIFLFFWSALTLIVLSVFITTSLYLTYQNDKVFEDWIQEKLNMVIAMDDARESLPDDIQTEESDRNYVLESIYNSISAISNTFPLASKDHCKGHIINNTSHMSHMTHMGKMNNLFGVYVFDSSRKEVLNRIQYGSFGENIYKKKVKASNGSEYEVFLDPLFAYNFKDVQFSRPIRVLRNFLDEFFLLWLLIVLAISTVVCFLLAWHISQPIRQLQAVAQRISSGNLDTRVSSNIYNRSDEIGVLGKDFNVMASHLQKLIDSQRQLLVDISHELRSPLARIQVALGLADKKANEEIRPTLDRIGHEAQRFNDLISQSLTLSRLDAGAYYPKNDYLNIKAFLENIVSDCNFEASNQQKKIILTSSNSWTIHANAELLRRALENIIRNAISYTPKDGIIDVIINENPNNSEEVIIYVNDHATGVPENKLDSLFQPFFRVCSARDRNTGGYGLGLAIAKRAVEFHNGKIKAENRPTGGLSIKVVLPILSANKPVLQ